MHCCFKSKQEDIRGGLILGMGFRSVVLHRGDSTESTESLLITTLQHPLPRILLPLAWLLQE